jgi:alkyl sulfatase BDS1-like metallo-beta-lactamase superfamily hydrolase
LILRITPKEKKEEAMMMMLRVIYACLVTTTIVSAYPDAYTEVSPSFCDGGGGTACTSKTPQECVAEHPDCLWRDTSIQNAEATFARRWTPPYFIPVADSAVWVAVGWGLANSVLILGPTGGIVIDTLESFDAAVPVATHFKGLLAGKPLVAIILSHSHTDHFGGTGAFLTIIGGNPLLIGHHTFHDSLVNDAITAPLLIPRGQYQFGTFLDASRDGRIHSGIGPGLVYTNSTQIGSGPPTSLVYVRETRRLAGLSVDLLPCAGETQDHVVVYVDALKLLHIGDMVYEGFPNGYSLRGTRSRPLLQWIDSLDEIRRMGRPTYMLFGHGTPLLGEALIRSTLQTTRDALQYVHDQTLFQTHLGKTLDEIIQDFKLPPSLAQAPFLQPRYGKIAWTIRGVWTYYFGWFSGVMEELDPLPRKVLLTALRELIGVDRVQEALHTALKDPAALQWAQYLASILEGHDASRSLQARARQAFAYQQQSATARNWLLTEAKRLQGFPAPTWTRQQLASVWRRLEWSDLVNHLGTAFSSTRAECGERLDGVSIRWVSSQSTTLTLVRNTVLVLQRSFLKTVSLKQRDDVSSNPVLSGYPDVYCGAKQACGCSGEWYKPAGVLPTVFHLCHVSAGGVEPLEPLLRKFEFFFVVSRQKLDRYMAAFFVAS